MVGGFSYPIGKFLFFNDKESIKVNLKLKELDEGITYIKKAKIFIYRLDDSVQVLDAHCTHMGCLLNYDKLSKKFNCPCHKSQFSIEGKRLKGPANRNLDKISFVVKNKILFIG